jgi:hypothetical protein
MRRHVTIEGFGASIPLYALGAIFLVPLSVGVLLVSSSATKEDHANQISRDLASMYAQGVDFSQSANQGIAMRVAEGLGMDPSQGVVILSKIRVVHDADCGSNPRCANKGQAVVTQRYVLGNPALRQSSFGTPAAVEQATGNIQDWMNDSSARAQEFPSKLKPGEFTYAAECYLASAENHAGVYSRVLF